VPLGEAGRIASWCHSGHCADTTAELPRLIGERRTVIADLTCCSPASVGAEA
jgi:hypothetical protein